MKNGVFMMNNLQVFKFGGASVKDAGAVVNLVEVLRQFEGQPLVVVVSAMGKMTNALERVADAAAYEPTLLNDRLEAVRLFHLGILEPLFPDASHPVYTQTAGWLDKLSEVTLLASQMPFDQFYDQVVSFGELISTTIIHHYLLLRGFQNHWLDARQVIHTDQSWRNGHVLWDDTRNGVAAEWKRVCGQSGSRPLMLTQGFVGRAANGFTTTLGREGSDFTAAVLAWSLDASGVTIWKDVPGVLNADPKFFDNTVKLDQISYEEAIELAYYGATVIHPKTIKPLQNKNIPLHVKSFLDPESPGSIIGPFAECSPEVPSFIFKTNQVLISIAPRDFSFIAEKNLQIIFGVFSDARLRINLMQNSAISFSVCADHDEHRVREVINQLKTDYKVRYNQGLQLVTIRRYTPEVIEAVVAGRKIFVEQRSRLTAQVVVG